MNTKKYYIGKKDLYYYADEMKLKSFEFDFIKRIARCRHKGRLLEDLQKSADIVGIVASRQDVKIVSLNLLNEMFDDFQLNDIERQIVRAFLDCKHKETLHLLKVYYENN
jgi:hypothetical protein